MDQFYDRDDFEKFLKSSADDFVMLPSRKTWYSLYNSMHPDRKWPSIAACILILFGILYIGVSNNNQINSAARQLALQNEKIQNEKIIQQKAIALANTVKQHIAEKIKQELSYNNNIYLANNSKKITTATNLYSTNNTVYVAYNLPIPEQLLIANTANLYQQQANDVNIANITSIPIAKNTPNTFIFDDNNFVNIAENKNTILNTNKYSSTTIAANADIKNTKVNKTQVEMNAEKAWQENYALKNKPKLNKLKAKGAITYYVTAALGFRNFSKTKDNKETGNLLIANRNYPSAEQPQNNVTALNIEAGAVISYKISKRVALKGGLQYNYTNYTTNATRLGHTTVTNIAVNSATEQTGASLYSTKNGSDKLNNTTSQISLPLGANYHIAGNGKIKWYVGATVQPTYVVSGSGYVLSADAKNYVAQPTLLRKFNLNTALETFVSFKPSPAVTLSVGPQFRYQILSTFKTEYNYSEKLYNLGVKVGLSTGL